MESVEIIKKLRFLPREELANLVIRIYSSDDDRLKRAIRNVSQKNVRKTASYILKYCGSEECIAILSEYGDLSDAYIQIIGELYKEYLYGKNPNLYFSQLISPRWNEFHDIKTSLPSFIDVKSTELSVEVEEKYKDFMVIDISNAGGVIEVLFKYQERIDYIDPKTDEPAFVYTLEEGIIWMVKSLDALITKSSNYAVSSFVNRIIGEYLSCRVRRFTLHKNIMNSVLGADTLRSGNYHKIHAGPDEIEGKATRDKNLMSKSEGRETDATYDRKSSFHKIKEITDSDTGLNVNSQFGRISIRTHLKKSEIMGWALGMINRIIDEMIHIKESDVDTYLKGFRLEDLETLEGVNKGGKEVVRDIVIGINKAKSEGKMNFSTHYRISNLYTKTRDYFNFVFIPTCNSCGSNHYVCGGTGEAGVVSFGGSSLTATCNSCGDAVADIHSHFRCNCGEQLEGGIDENTLAFPTEQFVNLINNIADEIGLNYKLDSNELLKFSNGDFEIIRTDYKSLYFFDELPAFADIPKFDEIEPDVSKAQLYNIKSMLGEKCENYNDSNCRDCLIDIKGHCLQRVIASFTEGDLHAHSPVEFGDISFRQDLDGSSQLIVCLAKSYNGAPRSSGDSHKYTMKNNGGLLNQLVETILDSRIDFIGIISGADLDPRLKETLITLVKLKGKKIIFFEKDDLVRILSKYRW